MEIFSVTLSCEVPSTRDAVSANHRNEPLRVSDPALTRVAEKIGGGESLSYNDGVALYRSRGAYLALPFFVIFSLTSLTESIAVVYNDMRWVIFVALAVKLALPDPAKRRAPPSREPRGAFGHGHRLQAAR